MSSGKTLKIIDYSLVRSAKNNASDRVNPVRGSINDQLRQASNRYYRDYIPKRTKDGRFIKKHSNHLIYGDSEGIDKTKMTFSNSLITEIHYGESKERCNPRLYENIQSVRIVGHAGFLPAMNIGKPLLKAGKC